MKLAEFILTYAKGRGQIEKLTKAASKRSYTTGGTILYHFADGSTLTFHPDGSITYED